MRRIFWLGSSMVMPGLLFIIFTPQLRDVLGSSNFGIFAFIYTVFQICSMLDFGASKTLTFYLSGGGIRLATVNFYIAGIVCLCSIVLWLIFYSLRSYGYWQELVTYPLSVALSCAFYVGCQLYKSAFDAIGRFGLGFASRISLTGIVVLLPIMLASNYGLGNMLEYFYPAFLISLFVFIALTFSICFVTEDHTRNNKTAIFKFSSMYSYKLFSFMSALLIVSSNYGERFILSSLVSLSELGGYIVTTEFMLKILLPSTLFSTILFLDLSKPQNAERSLLLLKQTIFKFGIVTGPLCFLILIFYIPIFSYWLNIPIIWGKGYFLIMVSGIFLNGLAAILSSYLEGISQQRLRLSVFFIYVPIHIIMLIFLVSNYGVNGAAIGWLVKGVLEVFFFSIAIKRLNFNFK